MKITKVDHTRIGILIPEEESKSAPEGVLYHHPTKSSDSQLNIRAHVVKRNEKAQGLYSVLISTLSFEKDEDKKAVMKQMTSKFNRIMRLILDKNVGHSLDEAVKEQLEMLNHLDDVILPEEKSNHGGKKNENDASRSVRYAAESSYVKIPEGMDAEELLKLLTQNSIRKSLRIHCKLQDKEFYLPDLLKELLAAVCSGRRFQKNYKTINKKRLETVLRCINEDYRKDKQMEQIVSSIEGQNVKIQVDERGYLIPSFADHRKRKYLFEFMKDYVSASKEEKDAMHIRFRQLVLLFYCGRNRYDASKDGVVTAWGFGNLKPDAEALFQKEAYRLILNRGEAKSNSEKKAYYVEIERLLHKQITKCYLDAVKVLQEEHGLAVTEKIVNKELYVHADFYWIDYIERTSEEIITDEKYNNPDKLKVAFLCEEMCKRWRAFIASKFVDYGKAVYHFAFPDLRDISSGIPMSIGKVADDLRDGITSFDYERIKAEDSLERDIAEYMIFAVNNFARASVPESEREQNGATDVLTGNNKPIYPDARRRILQFFGGDSAWKTETLSATGEELFTAIKSELYRIRNATFHYAGKINSNAAPNHIVKKIAMEEIRGISTLYGRRYFSNNVPWFYSDEQINKITEKITRDIRQDRHRSLPLIG